MGMYDREVSEKLGEDAVKEILKDAEGGLITKQHMEDIAKGLEPPKILGNHKRRGKDGANEMRDILSDWCEHSESFHDMTGEDALRLLIRIFKENTVSLKPLARRLEGLLVKGMYSDIFSGRTITRAHTCTITGTIHTVYNTCDNIPD